MKITTREGKLALLALQLEAASLLLADAGRCFHDAWRTLRSGDPPEPHPGIAASNAEAWRDAYRAQRDHAKRGGRV